jgi:hypothetical protein
MCCVFPFLLLGYRDQLANEINPAPNQSVGRRVLIHRDAIERFAPKTISPSANDKPHGPRPVLKIAIEVKESTLQLYRKGGKLERQRGETEAFRG